MDGRPPPPPPNPYPSPSTHPQQLQRPTNGPPPFSPLHSRNTSYPPVNPSAQHAYQSHGPPDHYRSPSYGPPPGSSAPSSRHSFHQRSSSYTPSSGSPDIQRGEIDTNGMGGIHQTGRPYLILLEQTVKRQKVATRPTHPSVSTLDAAQ
jgi:hypothetical protein